MKFAIYELATGQILRSVSCTQEQAAASCDAGQFFVPTEVRDDEHYIVDGVPVAFPAKPSAFHQWDWATRQWQPDLADALARKLAEIETERDHRINAPITYDGAVIDGDAVAQKNISDKLLEISQREALADPMPAELMVWRDAANVMHPFSDQDTYKAWLGGLAVALAQRGTEAYAWSWNKKAQARAATTLEQLDAIALND